MTEPRTVPESVPADPALRPKYSAAMIDTGEAPLPNPSLEVGTAQAPGYPKWVIPHPTYVVRDANGHVSVPGFEYRTDPVTAVVTVLVENPAVEAMVRAVKADAPRLTTLQGILPAPFPVTAPADYPKWIVPHESHVVVDGTGHTSVAGFPFHKDRVSGGVTVLVENEEAEKVALAASEAPKAATNQESKPAEPKTGED